MTLRRALLFALVLAGMPALGEPDEYAQLIQATRAALAKRAFDEAAQDCRHAIQAAKRREPMKEALALELCGDIETRRERHLEAARRYASAAKHSREDLKLRRKLLSLRKRAAEKAKAESSVALAAEVMEADRTLEQVTRRPRRGGDSLDKTLSALAEAAETYRKDRDRDRAEEALALRALVMVRSDKAEDGLRAVDRVLSKPNPSKYAALAAYEARTVALLDRGDNAGAATAAIAFNGLANPGARSPLLDRACYRYDQEKGAGQCARLEIRVTGQVTFTDYSLAKRKRELTDEDIERVHAQALPALEACVLAAAKKEPEFYRNVDIQISWVIDPEGRAVDIELVPKRNKPDIMPCAQERLMRVRYPKVFSRERKNVTIPYHLD